MWPCRSLLTDLETHAAEIRRVRSGAIEAAAGRLVGVELRWWPRRVSWLEQTTLGRWHHARWQDDRCRLYYHQPRGSDNYLAVTYLLSSRQARLATIHAALACLARVARLKASDALLCDVANSRLSGSIMARYGWELLRRGRWHRLYILRYYGHYPPSAYATPPTSEQSGASTAVTSPDLFSRSNRSGLSGLSGLSSSSNSSNSSDLTDLTNLSNPANG